MFLKLPSFSMSIYSKIGPCKGKYPKGVQNEETDTHREGCQLLPMLWKAPSEPRAASLRPVPLTCPNIWTSTVFPVSGSPARMQPSGIQSAGVPANKSFCFGNNSIPWMESRWTCFYQIKLCTFDATANFPPLVDAACLSETKQ